MKIQTEDIQEGALIFYDNSWGVLSWDNPNEFYKVYWARKDPGSADSSPDPFYYNTPERLAAVREDFSANGWCDDENLQEVHPPFKTKDEMEMWLMVNPSHKEMIEKVYGNYGGVEC